MSTYEYKAVPAPISGTKARGAKSVEDRFALSLTNLLNQMSAEGWEYVRAETLPCEERKGLTGRETTYQNVLIFRREHGRSALQELIEGNHDEDDDDYDRPTPRLGPASRD